MPAHSPAIGECHGSIRTVVAAITRTKFVGVLKRAKAAADRGARAFALCLVDIDQLRNINDCHGQRIGDAAILSLARESLALLALPEWRNLGGALGRYDGDSFILLLGDCRLETAECFADALRRRVGGQEFTRGLKSTVSLGVAAYRIGESTDALLSRLEKALYLAKQFGRDRVETAWTPQARERRHAPARLADHR